ncbi:MAG TPA: phosphatidate cytidylyltransferase, partial [bacterium]|nr:phosphatidate cytidylyltransferase [bacterium]
IYVGVAVLGVLCGAASQLGDLFMSCLKRQAQVKDSANLIPSQGGLLDKLDGLLFVLPVALGYLMIVGRFWEASRAG